jgi:hypothetical protein
MITNNIVDYNGAKLNIKILNKRYNSIARKNTSDLLWNFTKMCPFNYYGVTHTTYKVEFPFVLP